MIRYKATCFGIVWCTLLFAPTGSAFGQSEIAKGDTIRVVDENVPLKISETIVTRLKHGQELTVGAVNGNWLWVSIDIGGVVFSGWVHDSQVAPKWELPRVAPLRAIAPFDADQAKRHQQAWAEYLGVQAELSNSIGMKLTLIPPGEFMMGATEEEIEELSKSTDFSGLSVSQYLQKLRDEGPQHKVVLTKPFYMGVYEVTQEDCERVVGENPSEFSRTGSSCDHVSDQDTSFFPVECVSWDDAVEFCSKLSEQPREKAAGRVYRLPTEAEWEYACRAGTQTQWSFGNDKPRLVQHGWFAVNSGDRTHKVGELRANPFGLYDMHGNVMEWCKDWHATGYYSSSSESDPQGPSQTLHRVYRGGAWCFRPWSCRSVSRGGREPSYSHRARGFRVALEQPDK